MPLDNKLRCAISFGSALRSGLLAAIVSAFAGSAAAEEQPYYSGSNWVVTMRGGDGASPSEVRCVIRTTTWTSKRVVFEFPLVALDKISRAVRLEKDGWAFPAGQSTDVLLMVDYSTGAKITVTSTEDMALSAKQPDTIDANWNMYGAVLGLVFSTKKPHPLFVKFEGNEEPWAVPQPSIEDTVGLNYALERCLTDLTQMGPTLFGTSSGDATSPFAQKLENPAP